MNKKRIISALLILVMMFTAVPSVGLQVTAAKKVVKVKQIKLNKSKVTLTEGKVIQLKYSLTPKKTTQKKVSWSTSNKKVAKVSKSGRVTGVKRGTATITVKINGTNKKAKCKVTVVCSHKYKTTTVKSTCVRNGYTYKKCQKCGITSKKTYLKLAEHQFVETRVEPTCIQDGYVLKECKKCHKQERAVLSASHEYKETKVEPTCTVAGYILKKCEKCGNEIKTVLPASHKYKETRVEATCKKDGSLTKTCSVCGDTSTDVIKASGKDHVFTKEVSRKEATCEADGVVTYKCENCSETKDEVLTKLGHDDQIFFDGYQDSTCTEEGYFEYPCMRNGCNHKRYEIIKPRGCDDDVLIEKKPKTCLVDGYEIYQCLRCKKNHTNILKAEGHEMWYQQTVAATCTTFKYEIYKCYNCDYTEKKNWGTEYKHKNRKTINVHLNESCIDDYYWDLECIDCGAKIREYSDIPEWDHEYELDHYTSKPDCDHTGRAVFKCSVCDKTKEEDVGKLHDYEILDSNLQYKWEKCRLCGEETREFNDKEYVIDIGNGETATVVGHYDLETAEEMVVELNKYRKEKFRFGLKQNDKLMEAARIRAAEIEYQFGHERPNGTNIKVGENIMGGRDKTASEITHDFSVSPGHNDNMLNANYQYCGCAIFCVKSEVDGNYGMNIVQMFSSINQTGLSGIFEK